jgi:methyl coenzyme M reductase subunit D
VSLPLSSFSDGPWRGVGSNQYDADLLQIRLVRVTLRVQVGQVMLRGSSSDFAVRGLARGARTVSDYTLRFDVAPRNMNPGK